MRETDYKAEKKISKKYFPSNYSRYVILLKGVAIVIGFLFFVAIITGNINSKNDIIAIVIVIISNTLVALYVIYNIYCLKNKKIYIEVSDGFIRYHKTFTSRRISVKDMESIIVDRLSRIPLRLVVFKMKKECSSIVRRKMTVQGEWFSNKDFLDLFQFIKKHNKKVSIINQNELYK